MNKASCLSSKTFQLLNPFYRHDLVALSMPATVGSVKHNDSIARFRLSLCRNHCLPLSFHRSVLHSNRSSLVFGAVRSSWQIRTWGRDFLIPNFIVMQQRSSIFRSSVNQISLMFEMLAQPRIKRRPFYYRDRNSITNYRDLV